MRLTLRLPRLLEHQLPVYRDPSRFKLLVCGRRWGKTALGLYSVIRGHAGGIGAIQGGRMFWAVPNYPELKRSRAWDHISDLCRSIRGRVNDTEKIAQFPGGGSIEVLSGDAPKSMRGAGFHGGIIDEAALLDKERWVNELRPSLTDYQGWVQFQTTPNGFNWFADLFQEAEKRDGWQTWQKPSTENPVLPASEFDEALAEMGPRSYAQEYLAQFIKVEGALWDASAFGESIWVPRLPDKFEIAVIAVDPATGRKASDERGSKQSDYTAVVMVGLSGGLIWVDAWLERCSPNDTVFRCYEMGRQYEAHAVVVESNSFQSWFSNIADLLAHQHNLPPLPIVPVHHGGHGASSPTLQSQRRSVGIVDRVGSGQSGKEARIQRIDPYLSAGKLRFLEGPGTKLLVRQLQMFPDRGYHDDGPDALEMALWGLTQIGTPQSPEEWDEVMEVAVP